MAEQINKEYLKGLTFSGAETKTIEEDGIKKLKSLPFTRQAGPDDVLAWTDRGADVVIVMRDGRKHVVSKNPSKKEEVTEAKGKEKK